MQFKQCQIKIIGIVEIIFRTNFKISNDIITFTYFVKIIKFQIPKNQFETFQNLRKGQYFCPISIVSLRPNKKTLKQNLKNPSRAKFEIIYNFIMFLNRLQLKINIKYFEMDR